LFNGTNNNESTRKTWHFNNSPTIEALSIKIKCAPPFKSIMPKIP